MHHPIDYARVVKAIGNEMDITLIDTLEDILPQVRWDTLQARCQHALPCGIFVKPELPAMNHAHFG